MAHNLDLMRRGRQLYFCGDKKPAELTFYISENLKKLQWLSKPGDPYTKHNQFFLQNSAIRKASKTRFSLVSSSKRIEVECMKEQECDMWVSGITHCIKHLRRRQSSGDSTDPEFADDEEKSFSVRVNARDVVIKTGWLEKGQEKGYFWRWKQRFFVLGKTPALTFHYFARNKLTYPDIRAKGGILMSKFVRVVKDDKAGKRGKYIFKVELEARTYILSAKSEEERYSWIQAILNATRIPSRRTSSESQKEHDSRLVLRSPPRGSLPVPSRALTTPVPLRLPPSRSPRISPISTKDTHFSPKTLPLSQSTASQTTTKLTALSESPDDVGSFLMPMSPGASLIRRVSANFTSSDEGAKRPPKPQRAATSPISPLNSSSTVDERDPFGLNSPGMASPLAEGEDSDKIEELHNKLVYAVENKQHEKAIELRCLIKLYGGDERLNDLTSEPFEIVGDELDTYEETSATNETVLDLGDKIRPEPLWEEKHDEETDDYYYKNGYLGITQWNEPPQDYLPPPPEGSPWIICTNGKTLNQFYLHKNTYAKMTEPLLDWGSDHYKLLTDRHTTSLRTEEEETRGLTREFKSILTKFRLMNGNTEDLHRKTLDLFKKSLYGDSNYHEWMLDRLSTFIEYMKTLKDKDTTQLTTLAASILAAHHIKPIDVTYLPERQVLNPPDEGDFVPHYDSTNQSYQNILEAEEELMKCWTSGIQFDSIEQALSDLDNALQRRVSTSSVQLNDLKREVSEKNKKLEELEKEKQESTTEHRQNKESLNETVTQLKKQKQEWLGKIEKLQSEITEARLKEKQAEANIRNIEKEMDTKITEINGSLHHLQHGEVRQASDFRCSETLVWIKNQSLKSIHRTRKTLQLERDQIRYLNCFSKHLSQLVRFVGDFDLSVIDPKGPLSTVGLKTLLHEQSKSLEEQLAQAFAIHFMQVAHQEVSDVISVCEKYIPPNSQISRDFYYDVQKQSHQIFPELERLRPSDEGQVTEGNTEDDLPPIEQIPPRYPKSSLPNLEPVSRHRSQHIPHLEPRPVRHFPDLPPAFQQDNDEQSPFEQLLTSQDTKEQHPVEPLLISQGSKEPPSVEPLSTSQNSRERHRTFQDEKETDEKQQVPEKRQTSDITNQRKSKLPMKKTKSFKFPEPVQSRYRANSSMRTSTGTLVLTSDSTNSTAILHPTLTPRSRMIRRRRQVILYKSNLGELWMLENEPDQYSSVLAVLTDVGLEIISEKASLSMKIPFEIYTKIIQEKKRFSIIWGQETFIFKSQPVFIRMWVKNLSQALLSFKHTKFLNASQTGDFATIWWLLAEDDGENQVKPDYVDSRKDTALHIAVQSNDVVTVQCILAAAKELLDAKNSDGRSPLHLAATSSSGYLVQLLINKGSDVDQKDRKKKRAIDYSQDDSITEIISEAMKQKIEKNRRGLISLNTNSTLSRAENGFDDEFKDISLTELRSELLSSELCYLDEIQTIYGWFYVPIKREKLVSEDQFESVFSNIDKFLKLHQQILAKLQESHISQALLESETEFLELYINYIDGFEFCVNTIPTLCKNNPKLREFFKSCKCNLVQLLRAPIIHIPRYEWFLTKIKTKDLNNYDNMEICLNMMKDIQGHINKLNNKFKGRLEETLSILSISHELDKISDLEKLLYSEHLELQPEEPNYKREYSANANKDISKAQHKTSFCLLFSNFFVFEESKEEFRYLRTGTFIVEGCEDVTKFRLKEKGQDSKIDFICETEEQRNKWLKRISDLV